MVVVMLGCSSRRLPRKLQTVPQPARLSSSRRLGPSKLDKKSSTRRREASSGPRRGKSLIEKVRLDGPMGWPSRFEGAGPTVLTAVPGMPGLLKREQVRSGSGIQPTD